MTAGDRSLVAHLYRRAGFGATRDELDGLVARPYEDIVDDLLHPGRFPQLDDDILQRYWPTLENADTTHVWAARWFYRMINTARPLEEKMALFWHHVFATAWFKSEHTATMAAHIQMLRERGLGTLRDLLIGLARDPAMIYWLDNCENHRDAPNENFGRELLELFSMGIGSYDETDVKMAGRAFTGWTFEQPPPLYPYGNYAARFVYRPEDHDDGEKTFLGQTGRFNGEDIIDIISDQEPTARFIARHLYNFFVADEPQVPAWSVTPPRDPAAIDMLVGAYFESNGDMRAIMRVLLTAEFFKAARYQRIKSPAELVAGSARLSGDYTLPTPATIALPVSAGAMGQVLLDPPTVEGWHTGKEWIDGGTLTERVNFAVAELAVDKPGPRALIERLKSLAVVQPATLVQECLAFAGSLEPSPETRDVLLAAAESGGPLRFDDEENAQRSVERTGQLLRCIASSRDYQFA
jgi:uncharacterized protein (DUF1800 family)